MRNTNLMTSCTAVAALVMTVLGGGAAEAQIIARVNSSTVFNNYTPNAVNPANVFVTLPGSKTNNIVIPNNSGRLLLATFSAETGCFQAAAAVPAWCRVRIMFSDGVTTWEGDPQGGTAIDSNPNGTATPSALENHSLQRYHIFEPQAGGAPTITAWVERTTTDINTTLYLDDWTLSVLSIPYP